MSHIAQTPNSNASTDANIFTKRLSRKFWLLVLTVWLVFVMIVALFPGWLPFPTLLAQAFEVGAFAAMLTLILASFDDSDPSEDFRFKLVLSLIGNAITVLIFALLMTLPWVDSPLETVSKPLAVAAWAYLLGGVPSSILKAVL